MRTTRSFSLKTAIPTALVALIACITIAAAGQDVVVKVPFDFQAGQAHFAAGEYVLSMDKVSSGAMVIRRAGASQGDRRHRPRAQVDVSGIRHASHRRLPQATEAAGSWSRSRAKAPPGGS
jgi:hypothetical protein